MIKQFSFLSILFLVCSITSCQKGTTASGISPKYGQAGSGTLKKSSAKKPTGRGSYNNLILEYQQRMEENAKQKAKQAKDMKKPQYSDPTYFGHKKPPVKNPPGKKQYCKECGMYH